MADAQEFAWLNKQGVRSNEGFELQCIGRFEWEYRENSRVMKLTGEPSYAGAGGFDFDVGWRSQRWEPPHQWDAISEGDRTRIRENIQSAGRFMEHRLEFD